MRCGIGVLTVLDKLTEMRQARLLGLGVLFNDADQGVHDSTLVVKATLGGEGANRQINAWVDGWMVLAQDSTL